MSVLIVGLPGVMLLASLRMFDTRGDRAAACNQRRRLRVRAGGTAPARRRRRVRQCACDARCPSLARARVLAA